MQHSRTLIAVLLAAAASAAGCGGPMAHRDSRSVNRWMIDQFNDAAVENAIVAQGTIYPYHFVPGSPQLNELGERDLAVLASHRARFPGAINVRRGQEPAELYEARIGAVAAALSRAGVPAQAAPVTDAPPGAGGVESRRATLILLRTDKPATSGGQKGQTLP